MPRRYPVEFRRKVLDLIGAGKPVAEIAEQLGITAQTIYNWRNRARAFPSPRRARLAVGLLVGEPWGRVGATVGCAC